MESFLKNVGEKILSKVSFGSFLALEDSNDGNLTEKSSIKTYPKTPNVFFINDSKEIF